MLTRLIIIGTFSLLFLFPATLTAEIESFSHKIIKIAFMNGFVRAIATDLEKIKFLKENEDQIKEYINVQVEEYMTEVVMLNSGIPNNSLGNKRHIMVTK